MEKGILEQRKKDSSYEHNLNYIDETLHYIISEPSSQTSEFLAFLNPPLQTNLARSLIINVPPYADHFTIVHSLCRRNGDSYIILSWS